MDKYKSPYNGCVFPTDYVPRQAIIEAMYHYQHPLTEKEVNAIPAADVRENVIRTQGDKLRAMSDEELAVWLEEELDDGVPSDWLDWLKQEVSE